MGRVERLAHLAHAQPAAEAGEAAGGERAQARADELLDGEREAGAGAREVAALERRDAERVRPVDPGGRARRVDLGGDQRVEVPAHRLDVGGQEGDAAVLALVVAGVEVDELARALVEGGAHDLEHVGDRDRLAVGRHARALDAEAARRAAHAEAAGGARVHEQVAAAHGADPCHGRAAAGAALVEGGPRAGADLEAGAPGAADVAAHEEVPAALGEEREGRARGVACVDRDVDADVAGQDELERPRGVPGGEAGGGRVEARAAHGELELPVRRVGHGGPAQHEQPAVARSLAVALPSKRTVVRRPRTGGETRTRSASFAASAPSARRAGSSALLAARPPSSPGPSAWPQHLMHGRPTSVATRSRSPPSRPRTNGLLACSRPKGTPCAGVSSATEARSSRLIATSASGPSIEVGSRCRRQSGDSSGRGPTRAETCSLPTPARPRRVTAATAAGPAPATATRAASSRSCPRPPTSGSRIWRP